MRTRLLRARRLAWKLLIPAAAVAAAAPLALVSQASAAPLTAAGNPASQTRLIAPKKVNSLDCNGWSPKYRPFKQNMRQLCTDPLRVIPGGPHKGKPFLDNGWYVGHDEPAVKFVSNVPGSGNTMTYAMQLPVNPRKKPTASGSVTTYGELSVAPWFGLPICDPLSYPQNQCVPLSDTNSGSISNPNAAGSAFMELQFYPPGFTPFEDNTSCSKTQWCAALTIDSLECNFNFASCNNNCVEPVNFSYLQTNGLPPGPPAPQDPSLSTFNGNTQTLHMNQGDVLKVSITNVPNTAAPNAPSNGGLKAEVADLSTHQTGYVIASAANGFADTQMSNCAGVPHSFRAEYSTARKQNQVPWAALEGGVLMEQEIGHFESCTRVTHPLRYSASFPNGGTFSDPRSYQTCVGGVEGTHTVRRHRRKRAVPNKGEGPCNLTTFICSGATTQSRHGPVACPTGNGASGAHCEFADAFCFPGGGRTVTEVHSNGTTDKVTAYMPVTGCGDNFAQNGDLDYDGNPYLPDWPNGSKNFPASIRYAGPFLASGQPYPKIQFETDAPGSERLCQLSGKNVGKNCTAPPLGAKFYPFWTIEKKRTIKGLAGRRGDCIWNFGNNIRRVTVRNFGMDRQYGKPDVARYAGTVISRVKANPEFAKGCRTISL